MNLRFGLQAQVPRRRWALALLVVLALVALLWQRQARDAAAKSSGVSRQTDARRWWSSACAGAARPCVAQLADSLTNPMYYFDLDAIGVLARAALRQPDVAT